MENTKQKDMPLPISFSPKKGHTIILSEKLERKIRTYCALSPRREWSGVLFYTFKGDFKRGLKIHAEDMYLMDQGTSAHTEFDMNKPEITRYMVMEGLTGHCMGILHSHAVLASFFSGEDSDTLNTYGKEMNNFVSLIVNNEGKYVARVTRKMTFSGEQDIKLRGHCSYKLFNTDKEVAKKVITAKKVPANSVWVEYADLVIVKPSIEEDFDTISRFEEISTKVYEEKTKAVNLLKGTEGPWNKDIWDNFAKSTQKVTNAPQKEVQGKLWDDDEYVDDETLALESIGEEEWAENGYYRWLNSLVNGTPFNTSTPQAAKINEEYNRTFKSEEEFKDWFEIWLDYMVSIFDTSWISDDFWDVECILLKKVLEDFKALHLDYFDAIEDIINIRIS